MPDPTLLTRGRVEAQAVGAASNYTIDLLCGGDSTLVVQFDGDGAASTDWTVQVVPFEADNTTVGGVAVQPVSTQGPTFAGGRSTFYGQYDVTAFDKVRIVITNTTAGARNINRASWRLA